MTPSIPARPSTFWGPVLGGPEPDNLRENHEVLVIGAGIVGLSTALVLARQGVDVAVVDARRPGSGTSGKSTAKASLLQSTLASQIRGRHGDAAVAQYLQANRIGQDMIRDVTRETELVDVAIRDAWTYATTPKGAEAVSRECEALNDAGLPAELATPTELPFAVTQAVRLRDQVQINPAQYLSALLAELTAMEIPVAWPFRVAMIDSHRGQLHATSTQGLSTTASWIVIATLLPFPLRSLAFATTSPARSYVMAARGPAPHPQDMYISADSPTHSLRSALSPSGEEVLLVGGYGHPVGQQNPTSRHVRDLADWAHHHFDVREFSHRWSAQDYSSAHLVPQIGESPLGPTGVLVATGFGKWGITNAGAAAHAIAGRIAGAEPEWAEVFRPRAAGWARIASRNIHVGFTLAKGWLVEPHQGKGVRAALPTPRAVSHVDGRRHECSAVCTHLAGIVRWNDAEASWDCPLHGSRFAADGTVLEGPAVADLDDHEAKQAV